MNQPSRNETPAAAILRAATYAATQHGIQKRKDKTGLPYINHPLGVAEILARVAQVTDPLTLQAALLHDTVEDTDATPEDLERQFGSKVRDIVMEVTDDESLPKPERKQRQIDNAPNLSREARLIRIADKIYNCSEIRPDSPHEWSLEKKLAYLSWAETVVSRIRGTHPELERLFDETVETSRKNLAADKGGANP
jgi:guanosine-3',5'-bis(diphosphate) 3'-pyrophosphohydrolase